MLGDLASPGDFCQDDIHYNGIDTEKCLSLSSKGTVGLLISSEPV